MWLQLCVLQLFYNGFQHDSTNQIWSICCVLVISGPNYACIHSCGMLRGSLLTSYIVLVGVVDLFDAAVAEGEFPHPVDPAVNTWAQAERASTCWALEAIRAKVIRAASTDTHTHTHTRSASDPLHTSKQTPFLLSRS